MPRKKLTEEEKKKIQKENRLKVEYDEIIRNLQFNPEPTYFFNVGDSVAIGNLLNVKITEMHENGKFYKINYSVRHENYGHPYIEDDLERYVPWFDIRPINTNKESLVKNNDIFISFYSTQISNVLSKAYHFGVDMNPDYQRDYVWDENDKVALIDSIFNNTEIGKFCFIHKDYNEEYLYEILDGKQRLRAILDFYENRFPYKGKYFNDLSVGDKSWFENFSIAVAEVRESDKKEILRYFLMLNRSGKQMDKKHLEKIEEMYNNI